MDRFDLENRIMELHSVVDALNDISYGVIEGNLTQDETANAIDGLAVIVKMKAEKLFDTFTQVFHLDQYNDSDDFENYVNKCQFKYEKFQEPRG